MVAADGISLSMVPVGECASGGGGSPSDRLAVYGVGW